MPQGRFPVLLITLSSFLILRGGTHSILPKRRNSEYSGFRTFYLPLNDGSSIDLEAEEECRSIDDEEEDVDEDESDVDDFEEEEDIDEESSDGVNLDEEEEDIEVTASEVEDANCS